MLMTPQNLQFRSNRQHHAPQTPLAPPTHPIHPRDDIPSLLPSPPFLLVTSLPSCLPPPYPHPLLPNASPAPLTPLLILPLPSELAPAIQPFLLLLSILPSSISRPTCPSLSSPSPWT